MTLLFYGRPLTYLGEKDCPLPRPAQRRRLSPVWPNDPPPLLLHPRFHGEGYREGYQEGSILGVAEGRWHGAVQGARIGAEVSGPSPGPLWVHAGQPGCCGNMGNILLECLFIGKARTQREGSPIYPLVAVTARTGPGASVGFPTWAQGQAPGTYSAALGHCKGLDERQGRRDASWCPEWQLTASAAVVFSAADRHLCVLGLCEGPPLSRPWVSIPGGGPAWDSS